MIPASLLAAILHSDALNFCESGMSADDVKQFVRRLAVIVDTARASELTAEELAAEHAEDIRLAATVAEEQALDGIEVVSLGSDASLEQLVAVIGSAFGEAP